jgi:undecaprenyl-diphosphatase
VRIGAVDRLRSLAGVDRSDARLLWSLFGIALSVWAFVVIADLVTKGRTQSFDDRLMRSLRVERPNDPRGPDWLPGAMRDVTSLGSPPVLCFFVLAVVGALAVRRQLHALALLVAASAGGFALNELLKDLFGRPRPPLEFHLTEVRSMSFPSGHAMLSAIIYLTLAAFLARLVKPPALKLYFVGLAALLTLLVGASRVYLGVHYASDVFAGWTAGLAWALVCSTVASALQRQGSVEPPK